MNRIKRIGISMGTMCLASFLFTSSAFATNILEESSNQSAESQVSNADRLETELTTLQQKFNRQLKLLKKAANALATAQEIVSELKTDEYDSDIEKFEQDCSDIEASLEIHSKRMHKNFSKKAKEIIKRCEELLGSDDD